MPTVAFVFNYLAFLEYNQIILRHQSENMKTQTTVLILITSALMAKAKFSNEEETAKQILSDMGLKKRPDYKHVSESQYYLPQYAEGDLNKT